MTAVPRMVGMMSDERDNFVPAHLVNRLLQSSAEDAPAIVSHLPDKQRARVAYFCYSRRHLHRIGLAIAATCDLPSLIGAAPSNGAGSGLYAQSRDRAKPAERPLTGRRPITLAKSVSGHHGLAKIIALAAHDEPDVDVDSDVDLEPVD
jgi:hypothetical protein